MSEYWDWTVPFHCTQCGKEIYATYKKNWAYKKTLYNVDHKKGKNRVYMFCSWHCMREYEKTHKEPRNCRRFCRDA